MSIGGFLGRSNSITLDQFMELVKKGEVRYVMTGGIIGPGNESKSPATEIMNWVKEHGKAVSTSDYSNADASKDDMNISGNSN